MCVYVHACLHTYIEEKVDNVILSLKSITNVTIHMLLWLYNLTLSMVFALCHMAS